MESLVDGCKLSGPRPMDDCTAKARGVDRAASFPGKAAANERDIARPVENPRLCRDVRNDKAR